MINTERISQIRKRLLDPGLQDGDGISVDEIHELCKLAATGLGIDEALASARAKVSEAITAPKPEESDRIRFLERELARAARRSERARDSERRLEKKNAELTAELDSLTEQAAGWEMSASMACENPCNDCAGCSIAANNFDVEDSEDGGDGDDVSA